MRWGRKTQNEIRQVGLGHDHVGRARLDTIRSLVFIHHVDPRWDCKQRSNITQRLCWLEQQGESKARGRETHQEALATILAGDLEAQTVMAEMQR